MSLDMGGGISSLEGGAGNAEAVEEDYCQNAAERFREHWRQTGTFQPAALRHYGVRGDITLIRSIMQSRSFGASFGTFTLGDLRDFSEPPPLTKAPSVAGGRDAHAEADPRGLNGDFDVPMGAVLLGPAADPQLRDQFTPEETKAMQEELARSWVTLSQPSGWSQAMCGVLTVGNWVTFAQRRRARHQLLLASFMGVKAVQVPLPMLLAGRWQATEDDKVDWQGAAAGTDEPPPPPVSAEQYAENNWQLLAEVAEALAAFVRDGDAAPKVWVRCDACYPLQRRQFHALRRLVLYGAERDAQTGKVTGARDVSTHTASERTRRENIHTLMPLLYFSDPYALSTFSTEWLGEDIAAFEVPPADRMLQALQPRTEESAGPETEPQPLEESTVDYDFGGLTPLSRSNLEDPMGGAAAVSAQPSGDNGRQLETEGEGVDLYSLPGIDGSRSFEADDGPAPMRWTEEDPSLLPNGHSGGRPPQPQRPRALETLSESPVTNTRRRAGAKARRARVWQLPEDLLSRTESRWGGHYPARVSLVTFVVELMRRRVSPLFSQFFFDHYTIVNYLYFAAVADPARDNFLGYEDVLQLPLQPLGHQLSSGVYEVFERDASKYRQYREAFYAFSLDWVNSPPETHHHGVRCRRFAQQCSPLLPVSDGDKSAMYVVLLGSGRGPLIDEILSAASSLGVQVRLFALEKNAPAAAFTQLRWRCDPEWLHLSETFGHTLCTIVADARTVFDKRHELSLPSDFGLCDVVVSELLGSFGDNELSPECIEGFAAQLRAIQEERTAQGLSGNPHMACIPESYTAWAAPVHSVRLEQAVCDAAIKGLTVQPEGCDDRHAALFHSLLVCNLARGILLAAPQPCWSFHHCWRDADTGSRAQHQIPSSASDATRKKSKTATDDAATGGKGVGKSSDAARASNVFERQATLTFEVAPQGRCSGFAGFFSCVLYTPQGTAAGEGSVGTPIAVNEGRASHAVTIATAPVFSTRARVDGRTADMYSWFPCFFPLDPMNVRDLPLRRDHLAAAVTGSAGAEGQAQSKSASTSIRFVVSRHAGEASAAAAAPARRRTVWYSWRVDYGDDESLSRAAPGMTNARERRTMISNEGGWASTILL